MDSIFHEKQEGQLCAQHCLNSLLQGPFFTAVDLAGFAHELDEDEQATMAEGGFSNPDFLRFMQQPSSNMDDSGYFSVQVLSRALSVWNLELVPLTSPLMKCALDNPTSQRAFICNHDSHWLTVRKLGHQWFNLNSLLKRPELISDTYLSLFLHQLQMEGYAIFVVTGTLPRCEANDVLTLVRAEPPPAPSTTAHSSSARYPSHGGHSPQGSRGEVACSGHKRQSKGGTEMLCKHHRSSDKEEERKQLEEQELQMAMAMSVSLQQNQERYEVERQMQIRYRHQQHQEGTMEEEEEDPAFCGDNEATGYEEEEDEAALTAAIYASLEDEQKGKGRLPEMEEDQVQTPEHIGPASELTKGEEEMERGEKKEEEEEERKKPGQKTKGQYPGTDQQEVKVQAGGEETRRTEREGGDEGKVGGDSSAPLSPGELRMKRLKHLDQLSDSS